MSSVSLPWFHRFGFNSRVSALACATVDDGAALRTRVTNFISRPNYLQRNGKAFVSTFAGEKCTFGQGSVGDGWKTQFAQHPDLQGKMEFVPAFFIDPATFSPQFSGVMDGDFNVSDCLSAFASHPNYIFSSTPVGLLKSRLTLPMASLRILPAPPRTVQTR
jgi:hypothetical protein